MKVDPATTAIYDLTDDEAASLRSLCEGMLRGPVPLDHPLFVQWATAAFSGAAPAVLVLAAFLPRTLHALLVREEAAKSNVGRVATHARVAGGDDKTVTATHEVCQTGDDAVVAEQWTDEAGEVVSRYQVRLPIATLVHVVLNTTEEERAAIDARADWRGVV